MKHYKRISAILSVCLLVCIMATMFIVPASAASVNQTFYKYKVPVKDVYSCFMKEYHFVLKESSYDSMAGLIMSNSGVSLDKTVTVYVAADTGLVYTSATPDSLYYLTYNYRPSIKGEYFEDYENEDAYYPLKTFDVSGYTSSDTVDMEGEFHVTQNYVPGEVADSIDMEMASGVVSQIVGILPIVLVVLVGFIGLRKCISFVQNMLHSA